MGKRGSLTKSQSIRFPVWMANAIEEIAEKGGYTFTDVILDLLRQELNEMGYTMGIGREAVEAGETDLKKGNIDRMFKQGSDTEPLDLGDSQAG
jgi:hypothetical protein